LKDSRKNVFDALNAELKVLKDLQKTTGNAFAERKAVLEKAKQHEETKKKLKEVVDAAKKSSKDTSDLSKAEKSENIDKKISQLEYYLATHSLSLREEKNVIGDIRQLKTSKKSLSEADNLKQKLDEAYATSKKFSETLNQLSTAITKAKDREDAQDKIVKEIKGKIDESDLEKYKNNIDEAKKKIDDLKQDTIDIKAKFKKDNDVWYEYEQLRRKDEAEKKKASYEKKKIGTKTKI